VARSERKRSEGTGKTSGDGGNTLLKGHDGETAEGGGGSGCEGATRHREGKGADPDRRVAPRPTAARPPRA
jgi:hypothetical protein